MFLWEAAGFYFWKGVVFNFYVIFFSKKEITLGWGREGWVLVLVSSGGFLFNEFYIVGGKYVKVVIGFIVTLLVFVDYFDVRDEVFRVKGDFSFVGCKEGEFRCYIGGFGVLGVNFSLF